MYENVSAGGTGCAGEPLRHPRPPSQPRHSGRTPRPCKNLVRVHIPHPLGLILRLLRLLLLLLCALSPARSILRRCLLRGDVGVAPAAFAPHFPAADFDMSKHVLRRHGAMPSAFRGASDVACTARATVRYPHTNILLGGVFPSIEYSDFP